MISYARGPERPLLEITVGQALVSIAARCPDQLALVVCHQNVRLSWSQLLQRTDEVARGLAGLGLKPQDRIGIWSTNCVEWILLQQAAARAGIILINVNPAYRSHELAYVLRKSRMRAIFLQEQDARANYNQILDEAIGDSAVPLEHRILIGSPSWDRMVAGGVDFEPNTALPNDVTNIQYTSGTTGAPKGVLLTHRNLINNADLCARQLGLTPEDRICAPVPLYHCFGCVMASLASVASGAALVLPSPQFDALSALEAIHHERATAIYGVPTMFIAELDHPEFGRFDTTSLRTGIMAGAPCPVEVMNRVMTEMHCSQIIIGYGQTECSPLVTMTKLDDSLELRVSTVGPVLPNTEAKIVSQVSGETLPPGEQGELCTRGYHVMPGYDGEPEATLKAVDTEGWLHTGDLATMAANGYFRITGRAKDLIIRGGENIYPREVEEFLYTHPKIADVQVVGLPDQRLGEVVVAWIRLRAGEQCSEEEVRDHCRGKIAHFKIPQIIRFVEAFPMTVTGKIQKFKIREAELHRSAGSV
jgi:fatty-acyl-CoA synthase